MPSTSTPSVRRLTVLLAVGAALALLPAASAGAAGVFWDDDGDVHEQQIEGIAAAGVTRSCEPVAQSQFCTSDPVSRGQMAAFLTRALRLPPASQDHFTDDEQSIFEDDVNRLAESGITRGCNPPDNDRYCPMDLVTREQMAAFLDRGYEPAESDEDAFGDDEDSIFEGNINRIAAAGIARGCNPPDDDRYCPEDLVRRNEMASFLVRADDRLEPLDPWRLHERTITYEVEPYDGSVDEDLVPLLRRRAEEALYAATGWNIQHRLLLEHVADGGDFTLHLTSPEDVGAHSGCSTAYSCTVGDDVLINEDNFTDRPAPWAGRTQREYQRYLVLHEVGHWLDFDDTADGDDPSHYNDERYCFDADGDGDVEAPVMKQQSITTGDCTTNVYPLPFERDCVEESWLEDTTDQGDGDADIDDQCPHEPTQR